MCAVCVDIYVCLSAFSISSSSFHFILFFFYFYYYYFDSNHYFDYLDFPFVIGWWAFREHTDANRYQMLVPDGFKCGRQKSKSLFVCFTFRCGIVCMEGTGRQDKVSKFWLFLSHLIVTVRREFRRRRWRNKNTSIVYQSFLQSKIYIGDWTDPTHKRISGQTNWTTNRKKNKIEKYFYSFWSRRALRLGLFHSLSTNNNLNILKTAHDYHTRISSCVWTWLWMRQCVYKMSNQSGHITHTSTGCNIIHTHTHQTHNIYLWLVSDEIACQVIEKRISWQKTETEKVNAKTFVETYIENISINIYRKKITNTKWTERTNSKSLRGHIR